MAFDDYIKAGKIAGEVRENVQKDRLGRKNSIRDL